MWWTFSPALGADYDGAEVYRDNCTRCHAARSPSELGPDRWPAVLLHMRVKAGLTRGELRAIEAFLLPPPAPTPPPVQANVVLARVCVRCHDAQRIQLAVDAGRDRASWAATLDRMTTYGALMSQAEREEILSWLARP